MSKKTIAIIIVAIIIFAVGMVAGSYTAAGVGLLGIISQLLFGRKSDATGIATSAEQHVVDATRETDDTVGSMDTVVQAGGSLVEQSEDLIRESKEQSAGTHK